MGETIRLDTRVDGDASEDARDCGNVCGNGARPGLGEPEVVDRPCSTEKRLRVVMFSAWPSSLNDYPDERRTLDIGLRNDLSHDNEDNDSL